MAGTCPVPSLVKKHAFLDQVENTALTPGWLFGSQVCVLLCPCCVTLDKVLSPLSFLLWDMRSFSLPFKEGVDICGKVQKVPGMTFGTQ